MKKLISSFWKGELAKSGSLIFLASLSANIILFFTNLFIANQLGAINFGIFKTILYLFSFLPVLIELGINVSLTKYIAEFKNKNNEKIGHMIRWFLKLKIFSYSVLIALIAIFWEQITLFFLKDASLSYLMLPGILLASITFFSVFQYIVLGFHEFKLFALSQFLTLSSSAILSVLLTPLGVFYIILGWSFGPLIGNLLNLKFFFKEKMKKSKEFDVKRIFLKFSLPVYFVGITTNLFTVIIPILSLFFSQELVGYFSFAFIFYFATLLIPQAISSVVFPKVSELNGLKKYKDAKGILKKAFLLYSFVAFIGVIITPLISDWLFILFFESYLPSLFIFKVLVIFGLIFGFNTIYTNYLQGLGKVKKFALFVLIQNILLFVISFALLNIM
jgi:O-antigen/teichoic acid export membrane protein